MYKASNGKTYENLGAAMRGAYWGEIGKNSKSVTLKREGYSDSVITRGGPSPTGWHVSTMGNRLPQGAKKPAPKKVTIKYAVINGRCVKL